MIPEIGTYDKPKIPVGKAAFAKTDHRDHREHYRVNMAVRSPDEAERNPDSIGCHCAMCGVHSLDEARRTKSPGSDFVRYAASRLQMKPLLTQL
jgi:hypothetical protein